MYVTWEGLTHEELSLLEIQDIANEDAGALWKAVRRAIRDHFNTRRRQRRREQIQSWRDKGIYPYKDEPKRGPSIT